MKVYRLYYSAGVESNIGLEHVNNHTEREDSQWSISAENSFVWEVLKVTI